MAADDNNERDNQQQQGGGSWDSILRQLDGEKSKAKKEKVKAELKKILEERDQLEKGLRANDRKLEELREKYENDDL